MLLVPVFFSVTNVVMPVSVVVNIDTTDILRLPTEPIHTVARVPFATLDESHMSVIWTDGNTGDGLKGLLTNLRKYQIHER